MAKWRELRNEQSAGAVRLTYVVCSCITTVASTIEHAFCSDAEKAYGPKRSAVRLGKESVMPISKTQAQPRQSIAGPFVEPGLGNRGTRSYSRSGTSPSKRKGFAGAPCKGIVL